MASIAAPNLAPIPRTAAPAHEVAAAPVRPVERVGFLDLMRAYAIVLVVMVHVAGPVLYEFNTAPRSVWGVANAFDSFARSCVPLFVIISGFLLLDPRKRDEPLGDFFRKRLLKVVVPYLFWASFYVWWRMHVREVGWHPHLTSWTRELKQGIAWIVSGAPDYHLAFMNIIVGLYLLTPILRVFVKHASLDVQAYAIGLWFFLCAILPTFTKFSGMPTSGYLQVMPLFAGYFLLGAYLRQVEIKLKPWHQVVLLAVLAGAAYYTTRMTYVYTRRASGVLDDTFYYYISPNVIAMATISFLLLRQWLSNPRVESAPVVAPLMRFIGSASFGIYFVHVAFLDLLRWGRLPPPWSDVRHDWLWTATTFNPLFSIPLLTIAVVLVCAVVVRGLQAIPYVRALVP